MRRRRSRSRETRQKITLAEHAIEIESGGMKIVMDSATQTMTIHSGANLKLKAQATLDIQAPNINSTSQGRVKIKGAWWRSISRRTHMLSRRFQHDVAVISRILRSQLAPRS